MDFTLNLTREHKLDAIKSVQRALEQAKIRGEETGVFDNGQGIAKWANIYHTSQYTHLENTLALVASRNGWKTSMRLDFSDGTLYSFLSQKNFDEKRKRLPATMHFASALAYILNKDFEPTQSISERASIQISMDIGYDQSKALNIFNKMIGQNLKSLEPIKRFCLILLDIKRQELVGIKAVIINENFDVLHEEDWQELVSISAADNNEATTRSQETKQHDLNTPLKRKTKKEKNL